MARLKYQPEQDERPDNMTEWRRLPYNTNKSSYYATNYGAILLRMKRGFTVMRTNKQRSSPRSCLHGADKRGGRYQINSKGSPLHGKLIHRLVAAAFCPNDNPERNQVDHIDNNPANQRADNLRWCTGKENMQFYHEIKRGERIITNLQKSLFYVN